MEEDFRRNRKYLERQILRGYRGTSIYPRERRPVCTKEL